MLHFLAWKRLIHSFRCVFFIRDLRVVVLFRMLNVLLSLTACSRCKSARKHVNKQLCNVQFTTFKTSTSTVCFQLCPHLWFTHTFIVCVFAEPSHDGSKTDFTGFGGRREQACGWRMEDDSAVITHSALICLNQSNLKSSRHFSTTL